MAESREDSPRSLSGSSWSWSESLVWNQTNSESFARPHKQVTMVDPRHLFML